MKQLTIGRSKDNDITIDDASVSRHHATIIQTASGIVISDNGSSNGTFINGNRIHGEQALSTNDILKLGTALIPWRNYFVLENNEEERRTKIVSDQSQHSENANNQGQNNNILSDDRFVPAPPKKSKVGMRILSVIGVLLSIAIIAGKVLLAPNNSNSYDDQDSGQYNQVYVNPIVSEQVIRSENRGLFDKTLVGYVTITNDADVGGSVEVIATCTQEGKTWPQIKIIYMNARESQNLVFEFKEIERGEFDPNFSVVAKRSE